MVDESESLMKLFSKMKIGSKLGVGFGAVLMLMVGLGIFFMVEISKVNGSTVDIATNWLPSVKVLGELKYDALDQRRGTLNYLLAPEQRQQVEARINRTAGALADDEKRYQPMISSEEERKLYQ